MRKVVTFTIECEWDEEAGVWFVANSNVPGLAAEASTQEALNEVLRERIPELIQLNMPHLLKQDSCEVPIELLCKKRDNFLLELC